MKCQNCTHVMEDGMEKKMGFSRSPYNTIGSINRNLSRT